MTWSEWSDWFVRLYGLGDRFAPTVALWVQEIFLPAGLTPDELHAAALAVARGGAPKWPGEILPALQEEIRRSRAAAILARDGQARSGGAAGADGCALCDGSGWVGVPHCPQPEPALAKGFLATHGVSCRCHHGRRLNPRNGREEPSMTLDGYEAQNPRWREQMERERARRRAEWMAQGETTELGRLIERLSRQSNRPVQVRTLTPRAGRLPAPPDEGGLEHDRQ